jgi:hypothetical protein
MREHVGPAARAALRGIALWRRPLVPGAWNGFLFPLILTQSASTKVITLARHIARPPVRARALRPALRAPQQWCWTTRDINPTDMYMFDPGFVHDALAGRTPVYVAVSHAGHGVNPWAKLRALALTPLPAAV